MSVGSVSERLALILDFNPESGIAGLKRVGDASEHELGKSQDHLDRLGGKLQTAGIGMMAFGAVALVGLEKVAHASEEAEMAHIRLDNAIENSPKLAGQSSAAFTDLAEQLQHTTEFSHTATEEMMSNLIATGRSKDEVLQLTPAVQDLAVKMGGDLNGAAQKVTLALNGKKKGLEALVGPLDDVTYKTDRYAAVTEALGRVHGLAADQGKTFDGQLVILENSLKQLEEGVGVGVVDAFSHMFSGIEAVTGALDSSSPGAQKGIGEFATYAATGFVVVGALSAVAGTLIKAHERFSMLADKIGLHQTVTDADTAAVEANTAAAEASTVAAETQAVASAEMSAADLRRVVSNEALTFSNDEVTAALQARRLAEIQALVSNDALIAADAELVAADEAVVAAEDEMAVSSTLALGPIALVAAGVVAVGAAMYEGISNSTTYTVKINDVADSIHALADITTNDLDKIDAVNKMAGKSQYDYSKALAEQSIPVAQAYSDALARNGRAHADVDRAIQDVTKHAQDNKHAQEEQQAAMDGTTVEAQAQAKAMDEAGKAVDGYTGFIDNLASAMDKTYQATLEPLKLNDSYKQSINDLEDAIHKEGFALDATADKHGRYNEHALKDIDAVQKTGEAIAKLIEQRFKETHSVDDAVAAGSMYVANLEQQLQAAGLNQTQIDQMISTMNLTPDQIRTEFSNNAVEQQIVVEKYTQSFKDIPEEANTEIQALIDQGKFDEANAALDNLAHNRAVNYVPYANASTATLVISGPGAPPQFADGGFVDAPRGVAVPAIVHGGELVLTADEVDALSRSSARSGAVATGGSATGGAPTVNFNIGTLIGEESAVFAVLEQAAQKGFTFGPGMQRMIRDITNNN